MSNGANLVEIPVEEPQQSVPAALAQPPALHSVSHFFDLHAALFDGVHGRVGQYRAEPLTLAGHAYADPELIRVSVEQRFVALERLGSFAALPTDAFFDRLAFHIAELNAVAPFAFGNAHVLRVHSSQLAQRAGHEVRWDAISDAAWCHLLDDSFIQLRHDALAAALGGRLGSDDILCDARIGVSGLAFLPLRDPPAGRRYLTSLRKAAAMLEAHMPLALHEAYEWLYAVTISGSDQAEILRARHELSFLRHPMGVQLQLAVLTEAGFGKILAILHPKQSALEIVREISAATAIAINTYSESVISDFVTAVQSPICAPGASPHSERMAREFLTNSAADNRTDPRFAALQAELDAILNPTALDVGRNAKQALAAAEQNKLAAAEQIRRGNPSARAKVDLV